MAFENCSFWGGELLPSAQVLAGGSQQFGVKVRSLEQAPFRYAPSDFNFSSDSAISSPVESLASPNETEGEEEDDYIAGLAERIAHSMLDDDDTSDEKLEFANRNWAFEKDMWASDVGKVCEGKSPPPATFPGRGSWPTCSWSSNSSSKLSSPPLTPLGSNKDAWDLLYAAAGEMLRLKMIEESKASATRLRWQREAHRAATGTALLSEQIRQQSRRQSQTPLANSMHLYSAQAVELPTGNTNFAGSINGFCKDRNAAAAHYYQRNLSSRSREEDPKISGCQARPPKTDTMHGSAVPAWGRNGRSILQQQNSASLKSGQKGGCGHFPLGSDVLSAQRSHTQATGGSGMQAVFLGSGVFGRESCGTGVFLPRRTGSGMDTNKKPACSTVLLPTRIVQALNLNVEGVRSSSLGQNASVLLATNQSEFASLPSSPSSVSTCLSKISQKVGREAWTDPERQLACTHSCSLQREMSLPTEWTY
eukprot:c26534_g1_i1 orf=533-1966(-)